MIKRFYILCSAFALLASHHKAAAQTANTTTAEDSLSMAAKKSRSTSIGGYGNAYYQRDFQHETSVMDLERAVLFIGHKFNDKFTFFSELEVEDAKVSGGEPGGEVAFEQAYVKMNLNKNNYFTAGLFLPRIGILNENHLPTQFNGNERTLVETYIIPSTWRELGIGYYGKCASVPLQYSLALVNGLDAASFEHGSVIREGRYEGRLASANNIAITGALQYFAGNLRMQISGYYGGSVGLTPKQADTLHLESGMLGTPVALGEADLQYENHGFTARVLGSYIAIPDADAINLAYANNTPKAAYGAYAELAYNIFAPIQDLKGQELTVFARYEKLNMNAAIPDNGIIDGTLDQNHIFAGIGYKPLKNVVLKADVHLQHTGAQNPALVVNPLPGTYYQDNTLLNLGIGYSF